MSSNLIEFLTSKEILIVYLLAAVALLVCFIIYLIERNNEKLKQKHNTRELNKLVEQIKEEVYIYDEEEMEYDKPILETIEYGTDEVGSVEDLVKQTVEAQQENPILEVENFEEESIMDIEIPNEIGVVTDNLSSIEEEVIEIESIDQLDNVMSSQSEVLSVASESFKAEVEEDGLEYTDIEPDQATAKLELKKIEEELRKQEELSNTMNIALTNYEEQQEEAAIISLDELVKKGKELYEKNEVTQYEDEGNEPISLQDLEKQIGEKTEVFDEPFIIENVVPENTEKVEIEELILEEEIKVEEIKVEEFKPVVQTKFKISPVISPVYGIEKTNLTDLELENTANYDKLDEEIKKTNDFLTTLKDLQTKLDNNN